MHKPNNKIRRARPELLRNLSLYQSLYIVVRDASKLSISSPNSASIEISEASHFECHEMRTTFCRQQGEKELTLSVHYRVIIEDLVCTRAHLVGYYSAHSTDEKTEIQRSYFALDGISFFFFLSIFNAF